MFGVGRAVAGLGSGILAIVVPIYQGEVATAETRGALVYVAAEYCWYLRFLMQRQVCDGYHVRMGICFRRVAWIRMHSYTQRKTSTGQTIE